MSSKAHFPSQFELDLLAKHVTNHSDLKLVRTAYNRMSLSAIELEFKPHELGEYALMRLKEQIMDIIIRKMIGDAGGNLKTTLYSSEGFQPHLPVGSDFKTFYNKRQEKKRVYEKGLSIASIPTLENYQKPDKKSHMAFVMHVYLW